MGDDSQVWARKSRTEEGDRTAKPPVIGGGAVRGTDAALVVATVEVGIVRKSLAAGRPPQKGLCKRMDHSATRGPGAGRRGRALSPSPSSKFSDFIK